MSPAVTTWLALLVSAIWAVSMIVNVVQPAYVPPSGIHGALMLVLAGVFGVRAMGKDGHAP